MRVLAASRAVAEDAVAAIKSNGDNLSRALAEADIILVVARIGDDVGLINVAILREGAEMLVVASDESYVAATVTPLGLPQPQEDEQ